MQSTLKSFHLLGIILFCCLFPIVVFFSNSMAKTGSESTVNKNSGPVANIPKPIPRARWSEDWSTFGDASPLLYPENSPYDYFWAPIKYIPLNTSKESYLSFGGELRLAYEFYDEKDMGISDIGYQDALQLRLAVHGDWHLNERWRIFGQLGYGTVDNREGGEKVGDEADVNIWELFIGYRLPVDEDERVVIRQPLCTTYLTFYQCCCCIYFPDNVSSGIYLDNFITPTSTKPNDERVAIR